MKLQLSQDHPHKSRDARIIMLAKKMKERFPEKFTDPRLNSPQALNNGGLFAFCDDICQLPAGLTAPLLSFSDIPLIYWGCNDPGWVKASLEELEALGKVFQSPYKESFSYSAHYYPSRDGEFFSTLEIVYPFFHGIWQTGHWQIQEKMRDLLSKYGVNGFKEERIQHYSMNIIILESSRLYSFHHDETVILDQEKKKSEEIKERGPVYMDAPLGFCLSYRGQPNALVAFWPESASFALVHQIQGINTRLRDGKRVRDYSRGLIDLDWRPMMLEFASWAAQQAGMKIAVLGAKNNSWTRPDPGGRFHIDYLRAVELYDKLAERTGMQKAENGNYYQL